MPPSRRTAPAGGQQRPLLRRPADVARTHIETRLTIGRELGTRSLSNGAEYESVRAAYRTWEDGTTEMLRQLFTTDEVADGFAGRMSIAVGDVPLSREIQYLQRDIASSVRRLEGTLERLPYFDVVAGAQAARPVPNGQSAPQDPSPSDTVFVVHGRDMPATRTVEAYLRKIGLDVIVLSDQASGGATLIEKIETHGDVGYVVALLTPDDVGSLWTGDDNDLDLKPRARENVIFELGYFVGRLKRGRVAALVAEAVTLPSDLGGFVYIKFDASDTWKLAIVRDLTRAGFAIDPKRV
jgi:predicted nucleotide-binding protein